MGRIDCRDRGGSGKGHSQGFSEGHHGCRGSHRHTGSWGTGNTVFDFVPTVFIQIAGTPFGPVFPDIGPAAQGFSAPVTAKHRPAGHIDRRQVHADGAHQHPWCRLVASSHQDCAVDGITPQQFFRFHGEKIAVHHCGRFHQLLPEREGR